MSMSGLCSLDDCYVYSVMKMLIFDSNPIQCLIDFDFFSKKYFLFYFLMMFTMNVISCINLVHYNECLINTVDADGLVLLAPGHQ